MSTYICIYIYIYIYVCVCVCAYAYQHYHHQVTLLARISLTLSLSIRLNHPLLPAGLPDYIQCPRRAFVGKFLQINQIYHKNNQPTNQPD